MDEIWRIINNNLTNLDFEAISTTRATIRGNQILARSGTFAVIVHNISACDFSHNQLLFYQFFVEIPPPSVFIHTTDSAIVAGNRVDGTSSDTLIYVPVVSERTKCTVLGNITRGNISVNSNAVNSDNLNVIGV